MLDASIAQLFHIPMVLRLHGLLLPFWVRPYSSPLTTMGTPRDTIGISQLLRQRARRNSWSPPESQDTFASVPPSEGPNGKGCWLSLSLKLTKSNIVKPSWAVRKLMDF